MTRSLLLGLLLSTVVGCGEEEGTSMIPAPPRTLAGCVDEVGERLDGETDEACGWGGAACFDCTTIGDVCSEATCVNPRRLADGRVDDSEIRVMSESDVIRVRRDLVRFIWRDAGFAPETLTTSLHGNVASPIADVPNLARVDRLDVELPILDLVSRVFLFIPEEANGELVVFHQGHDGALRFHGGDVTTQHLVGAGYLVAGVSMPLYAPNDRPIATHDQLLALDSPELPVHPVSVFLDPVGAAIHHAREVHGVTRVSMIGISGGGWTTTVYAALDPQVTTSFPVAGTMPISIRVERDLGDAEQWFNDFYRIAGYPDLYVMGSADGRTQAQILNRYDSCCFAGNRHEEYSLAVAAVAESLAGRFLAFLDESHHGHTISVPALEDWVLPILNGEL